MDREQCLNYLHLLLTDVQHARSVSFENGHTEEEMVMIGTEKWLFGKDSIVRHLPSVIDKFECNTEVPIMDLQTAVLNFSTIARSSLMLRVTAATSRRKDPEVADIYNVEGVGF